MLERIDALRWAWIALISAGCTTLAGLDEDYVPVGASGASGTRSNAGGTSGGFGGADGSGGVLGSGTGGTTGGAAGAGGSWGAGNASGSAGTDGLGGSGGTPMCPSDQKLCNGECVDHHPNNGCGSSSCEACPAPDIENVEVWCNGAQMPVRCDVRCVLGYVPDSGRCVPEGTVGSGGTGAGASGGTGGSAGGGSGGTTGSAGTSGSAGTGGSGGRCSPNTCPPCLALDGKIPCCAPSGRCGCGYPVVGAFYCI